MSIIKTFEFCESDITCHACYVNEDTLFFVSSTSTKPPSEAADNERAHCSDVTYEMLSAWIHQAAQEIGGVSSPSHCCILSHTSLQVTHQLSQACTTIQECFTPHLQGLPAQTRFILTPSAFTCVPGARKMCGMIVYGPSGVGKTSFVNAVLRYSPYRSIKVMKWRRNVLFDRDEGECDGNVCC